MMLSLGLQSSSLLTAQASLLGAASSFEAGSVQAIHTNAEPITLETSRTPLHMSLSARTAPVQAPAESNRGLLSSLAAPGKFLLGGLISLLGLGAGCIDLPRERPTLEIIADDTNRLDLNTHPDDTEDIEDAGPDDVDPDSTPDIIPDTAEDSETIVDSVIDTAEDSDTAEDTATDIPSEISEDVMLDTSEDTEITDIAEDSITDIADSDETIDDVATDLETQEDIVEDIPVEDLPTDTTTDEVNTDATGDTESEIDIEIDSMIDSMADTEIVINDQPSLQWPVDASLLPNNRIFVSWDPATDLPANVIITSYELCATNAGLDTIDEASECPTGKFIIFPFTAIDALTAGTTYIKVRANYDDGTQSQDSAIHAVSTDDSLLARYTLDESSGLDINDSSGANLDGTAANIDLSAAWQSGIIATGLSFDGLDDYVGFGDAFNFDNTDGFTVDSWTQRAIAGSAHMIFGKMDFSNASVSRGYWLGFEQDDKLQFMLRHDNGTNDRILVRTQDTYASPDTPRHVAFSYDGSGLASGVAIHVNAANVPTQITSDSLTGTLINSSPARLGAAIANGGDDTSFKNVFQGIIDDVAIYNRALSSEEIINNLCAREALNREQSSDPTPLPAECN